MPSQRGIVDVPLLWHLVCLCLSTVASVYPQKAQDGASNGEALPMEAFRAPVLFVALDCVWLSNADC
jgi:hypothetical protein